MRKLFEELDNTREGKWFQKINQWKLRKGVKWTGMLGLYCGGKIAEDNPPIIHGYEVSNF